MTKKLILIGAGPGDAELISLKGIKALQQANVVMYDALVSEELLQHAPNAIHVFCGKRAGTHYMKQDEINHLIVENANRYGIVVRLKGGDPFVFGRGQEEIEYAEKHGIITEVIPGISSATALATAQKIPLTKRGITESVWITTGTTSCGKLSEDIELAAQSSATVVILMGIGKLDEIVEVFKKHKQESYPIAIIQNGTLPDEKIVKGNLNTIQELVQQEQITSPAVIILGEVIDKSIVDSQQSIVPIKKSIDHRPSTTNQLYPIFLKTENFNILIVGGGFVGTEKLSFILKNSPNANITVVAKEISQEIRSIVDGRTSTVLIEKEFENSDLENKQLVIAATADKALNESIYQAAKAQHILINVADTPELCDFYLGSVVSKGDLKIAISTNGKSPTLSKRLREFFEDILPDNINDLILNLNEYRNTLKGNFEEKVNALNEITKNFLKR